MNTLQTSGAYDELVAQQESLMYEALRHVEDRLWSLDEVKARARLVRIAGWPFGRETFCVDGMPLLDLYPCSTKVVDEGGQSVKLILERPFRKRFAGRT